MLAMVVDCNHSDWHLWLKHVAFAYNAAEHASTGVTPFMLATGCKPRIALHRLLGDMQRRTSDQKSEGLSADITDTVASMMHRLRQAQDQCWWFIVSNRNVQSNKL